MTVCNYFNVLNERECIDLKILFHESEELPIILNGFLSTSLEINHNILINKNSNYIYEKLIEQFNILLKMNILVNAGFSFYSNINGVLIFEKSKIIVDTTIDTSKFYIDYKLFDSIYDPTNCDVCENIVNIENIINDIKNIRKELNKIDNMLKIKNLCCIHEIGGSEISLKLILEQNRNEFLKKESKLIEELLKIKNLEIKLDPALLLEINKIL